MVDNVAVVLRENPGHLVIQAFLSCGVFITQQTIQQSKLDSQMKMLPVHCWKTQLSGKRCESGI